VSAAFFFRTSIVSAAQRTSWRGGTGGQFASPMHCAWLRGRAWLADGLSRLCAFLQLQLSAEDSKAGNKKGNKLQGHVIKSRFISNI
jgi:hypothetical protein